ncbi:MAG: Gfo/Idh/MocA family oxidoreductase, partial [Actinomycetota bacterium]
MTSPTRIGVVGTSWWADSMYLPALRGLADVEVAAVLGRNPDRAAAFAQQWEIPGVFTDADPFFDQPLDGVIIASANDSHHPLSMQAIDAGLDVLCEKPLGLDVTQAREMTAAAAAADTITLVPFTYRYMPVNQYVKRLIDEGYLGEAFHLGLRYFTGFARDGEYAWRFDRSEAGSGVIGDIGSHFLYLARWFFGEVASVGCLSRSFVARDERPESHDPSDAIEASELGLGGREGVDRAEFGARVGLIGRDLVGHRARGAERAIGDRDLARDNEQIARPNARHIRSD